MDLLHIIIIHKKVVIYNNLDVKHFVMEIYDTCYVNELFPDQ